MFFCQSLLIFMESKIFSGYRQDYDEERLDAQKKIIFPVHSLITNSIGDFGLRFMEGTRGILVWFC